MFFGTRVRRPVLSRGPLGGLSLQPGGAATGLPLPGNRRLTLSVDGVDHPSPVCLVAVDFNGNAPGSPAGPETGWTTSRATSPAICSVVTARRNAFARSDGRRASRQSGTECTQAPRPGNVRPTSGPAISTDQAIRTSSVAGTEDRHATHLRQGTDVGVSASVERPTVGAYSSSSPESVAATVHSPAETAGPPSAGFQTCSPVSSSTIHSPSAHSTSA